MTSNNITIEQIDELLQKRIKESEERMEKKFNKSIVDNNEEILQSISYLPTKEEFYTSQSELSGEIKDLRDEVTIHNGIVQENRERIEKLEKHVFRH